jgi:hypothetical protein
MGNNVGVGGSVNETAANFDESYPEKSIRERKKEANDRFRERRIAQRDKNYKLSLALKDVLVGEGVFAKLGDDLKAFIAELTRDPSERATTGGFGGPSVFGTIFGELPKIGDTVSLQDIFDKTAKGKSTMDVWLKRWDEKGIKVEFKVNKEKFTQSTYTIKALPAK